MAKVTVPNLKTARGVAAAFKKLIPKIEAAGYTNVQIGRAGLHMSLANPVNPWDRDRKYSQFSGSGTIGGCCGVSEITGLYRAYVSVIPGLSTEDSPTLFAAQLHGVLKDHRTKLAIATTIPSQRGVPELLEAVGFTRVTTTRNPKTRRNVTLWTYHRA